MKINPKTMKKASIISQCVLAAVAVCSFIVRITAGKSGGFLHSFWGFFACIVLPIALLFLWRVYKLMAAVIDYRKHSRDEEQAEI